MRLQPGYEKVNGKCVDIDECATKTDMCVENDGYLGKCENTVGGA